MSRPSKRMRPARAGVRPRIERSVVVLPAPFGPSSATTSPAADLERDVEQRLRLAVEALSMRVDAQHQAMRPQVRARAPTDWRAARPGVPSAMTWPQWITEIRSASPNRNRMSCSMITMVTRARRRSIRCRRAGARPRRPGRRSARRGTAAAAPPRARRRSPARAGRRRRGSRAGACSLPARPTSASTAAARACSSASRRTCAERPKRARRTAGIATSTLSSAL